MSLIHRVKLLKTKPNGRFECFLVDVGTRVFLKSEDLYVCPSYLAQLPFLAMKCGLNTNQDDSIKFTEQDNLLFQNIVALKGDKLFLQAKWKSTLKKYFVELFCIENGVCKSVNGMLFYN